MSSSCFIKDKHASFSKRKIIRPLANELGQTTDRKF